MYKIVARMHANLPAKFDNCMHAVPIMLAIITRRELNLNLKIDTICKNLCNIRCPFTYQGLPNHTTFRPIIKLNQTYPIASFPQVKKKILLYNCTLKEHQTPITNGPR
jgi:hypothetical protein